jgi:hypothetical protein
MKRILVALAALAVAFPAQAQMTNQQKALLDPWPALADQNPGFESGTARWTNSGSGTFTTTTTTANVAYGASAASWDAAANNDTLTSAQVSVPPALYGQPCRVEAWYKGGDKNLTAQVINGSSTVLASQVLVTAATFEPIQLYFLCPTSGTVAFRLKASADAAVAYLDHVTMRAVFPNLATAYVKSPSNAQGWAASSTGVTVATTTTSSELPRLSSTGIKITPVSSTDYARYRFTLDPADYSRVLQLRWDQKPVSGYATGDLTAAMYCTSDSTYATGLTAYLLNNSSAVSIPNSTGQFRATWASDSSNPYCEIRIARAAGTTALVISSVSVDTGAQSVGTVVTEWTSYTPTVTNMTLNATGKTDPVGKWRRVGTSMELAITFKNGSGGAATGGSQITFALPSGYTIDTTALPTGTTVAEKLGDYYGFNVTLVSNYDRVGAVVYASTTTVRMLKSGAATMVIGTDIGASAEVSLKFAAPILEWAGSGVVNMVNDDKLISDWTAYTPTVANLPGTPTGYYRRVGTNVEIQVYMVATGAATGTITASIPSGLTIDTTSQLANSAMTAVGTAAAAIASGNNYIGSVQVISSTTLRVSTNGSNTTWNATNPPTWANNSNFNLTASVPVNEWKGKTSGALGFLLVDQGAAVSSRAPASSKEPTRTTMLRRATLVSTSSAQEAARVRSAPAVWAHRTFGVTRLLRQARSLPATTT